MSNLTQFFGAVPSTASTATPITGTAVQALTAGDGVYLTQAGSFAKQGRASFVGPAVDTSDSQSPYTDNSGHGKYVGRGNYRSGEWLSTGHFLQLGRQVNNGTGNNYYGFRTYTMNSDRTLVEAAWISSAGAVSQFYQQHGMEARELFSDATYTYVGVGVFWRNSSSYGLVRPHILKIVNATGAMIQMRGQDQNAYYSADICNIAYQGGGGGIFYADGVVVHAYGYNASTNGYNNRFRVEAGVYNPATHTGNLITTFTQTYIGSQPADNYTPIDFLEHDAASRTFISFETLDADVDSRTVTKHVFAADATCTTTTISSAFALANITALPAVSGSSYGNAGSRIFKISAGVYAMCVQASATTYCIQKFTYDGNTTLAQSGNLVTLTLPAGLEFQYPMQTGGTHRTHQKLVNNDPTRLIIQTATGTTSASANNLKRMWVGEINLVAGTLVWAKSSYGLEPGGAFPYNTNVIVGPENTYVLSNNAGGTEGHDYQIYGNGYFTVDTISKEIVGVALADAAANATNASIALFDGIQSTTALPTGTYVQKNGQYYLQDIEGSVLGEVEIKSTGALVHGGLNASYNTSMPNQLGISTSMNSTINNWNGPNGSTTGTTGWSTYKGSGGNVWSDARFNIYIYPHRYSAVCPVSATTNLVSIAGRGRLLDRFAFCNGHSNSYTAGWELWIDGVRWYYQNARAMTQGTAGYYSVINFEYMTGVPYLDFKESMVFKCVEPSTATNITNYCFFRLGRRG